MGTFAWCFEGLHAKCHREYEVFVIDPKKNSPVFTGETVFCECPKRGCECYVPVKERSKKKKAKRKGM